MRCEDVRDRLPERGWEGGGRERRARAEVRGLPGRVTGSGARPPADDGVEAHLETCRECRSEEELIALLVAGRPEAPEGLAGKISRRLRGEGGRASGRRWWRDPRRGVPLAAAAAAALLLLVIDPDGSPDPSGPAPEVELARITEGAGLAGVPELFVTEDAVVAGAPVPEELSEEALSALLAELEG